MVLPSVSVITVVYNSAALLNLTLKSVLDQSFSNLEHVIIDGGSTDETLRILETFRGRNMRWVSERDQGIYDAMNKGLSMAKADFVVFLNAGDTFVNTETVSSVFEGLDTSLFDLVYGDSINTTNTGSRYISANKLISIDSLRTGMGLCHQSVFVRRSIAPQYDITYKINADYQWIIDIVDGIQAHRVLHRSIPIVYYRLGGISERQIIKNLMESAIITRTRFGMNQVLLNIPGYAIRLLRMLKYKWFGYGI